MIETKRLLIRGIQISDAQDVYEYRSDAKENEFQGWVPKNIQDVEGFINNNPKEFNITDTWFQLALMLKENGSLIGDIGIHFADEKQVEIGFTLSSKFQKQGFAIEAVHACIQYLFNDFNKYRIYASIDPKNVPSYKLLEKLGFRKEAHHIKSLYFKGQWVDDVIYAIVRNEWM